MHFPSKPYFLRGVLTRVLCYNFGTIWNQTVPHQGTLLQLWIYLEQDGTSPACSLTTLDLFGTGQYHRLHLCTLALEEKHSSRSYDTWFSSTSQRLPLALH